jgi:acetyltransferase-like isoleucine patch superfamily enzyme
MKTSKMLAGVLTGLVIVNGAYASEDRDREDSRRSISQVNSSIELEEGERVEQLHTVNGSIRVGNRAVFASAETVNGSIRIGDDCQGQSLNTVNGRITIGKRSVVTGDITTVNGRLDLDDEAQVQGDASNVNSNISIGVRARVGGHVMTRSGDVTLSEGAQVKQGIMVKSGGWWSNFFNDLFGSFGSKPVITIGPNAQVGEMEFEREVELRVHSTAKIGTVKGATVSRY